jgi:hypothetical protein
LRKNSTIRVTIISGLTGLRYRIDIRKYSKGTSSLHRNRHDRNIPRSRTDALQGSGTDAIQGIRTEVHRETKKEVTQKTMIEDSNKRTAIRVTCMRQTKEGMETGPTEGETTAIKGHETAVSTVRNLAQWP